MRGLISVYHLGQCLEVLKEKNTLDFKAAKTLHKNLKSAIAGLFYLINLHKTF